MMSVRKFFRNALAVATGCLAVVLTSSSPAGASEAKGAGEPGQQNEPVLVDAEPTAGFHHPYFFVLPGSIHNDTPFVVALPTPTTSSDPRDYVTAAERIVRNAGPMLRQLDLPALVPVLPRPPVQVSAEHHIDLYIPALSREALLCRDPKLARMDLQLLAMLEHARERVCRQTGARLQSRAVLLGFSAAGHFATRMAVLHPTRMLAVWAGGMGGHPILPVASCDGKELTYPVGISDLPEVVGTAFDAEAFKTIHLMIVQGGADTNSSLPLEDKPSDSYSYAQALTVFDVLGKTAEQRIKRAYDIYAKAGATATFKMYPGVGHQMAPEVVRDLVEFVRSQVRQ